MGQKVGAQSLRWFGKKATALVLGAILAGFSPIGVAGERPAAPSVSGLRARAAPPAPQPTPRAVRSSTASTSSPPISIGMVHGQFYPNPNDSGSLDLGYLTSPVFAEDFSVIDFNPPAAAQVNCSNGTGIDENTRPFTDVT